MDEAWRQAWPGVADCEARSASSPGYFAAGRPNLARGLAARARSSSTGDWRIRGAARGALPKHPMMRRWDSRCRLLDPGHRNGRVAQRFSGAVVQVDSVAARRNKIRYQQTAVGALWAILQPLMTMAVFTVLFGRLMNVPTGGVPYPAFALCALAPWSYFVHALTITTRSLVDQHDLVTKVYFPRLILPIVATLEATVDFLISTAVLLVLLPMYGIWPSWRLLALPFLLLALTSLALGAGLWLSATNLRYRDVMSALPFAMQVLLFSSRSHTRAS